MIRIIDTNLILRLVLNDIPEQMELAKKLLTKHRCLVLDVSVFECVYILKDYYNMPLQTILESLNTVLLQLNIEFNSICLSALESYAQKPSVSYADWYLLETAKQKDGKLYTFDKNLVKHSEGVALQPS